MFPLIMTGIAAFSAFLSGCSRKPKELPKEGSGECVSTPYSRNYVENFRLPQAEAETLCEIEATGDISQLERQYYQCAIKLYAQDQYQAAGTIFRSLLRLSEDKNIKGSSLFFTRSILDKNEFFRPEYRGQPTGFCDYNIFEYDHQFDHLRSLKNYLDEPSDGVTFP